jgi:hypothetical protein
VQYASVHQNTHRTGAVTKLLNRCETLCRLLASVGCDPFSQLVTLDRLDSDPLSLFPTSSTSAHNNVYSTSLGVCSRDTALTVLLLGCKMLSRYGNYRPVLFRELCGPYNNTRREGIPSEEWKWVITVYRCYLDELVVSTISKIKTTQHVVYGSVSQHVGCVTIVGLDSRITATWGTENND